MAGVCGGKITVPSTRANNQRAPASDEQENNTALRYAAANSHAPFAVSSIWKCFLRLNVARDIPPPHCNLPNNYFANVFFHYMLTGQDVNQPIKVREEIKQFE